MQVLVQVINLFILMLAGLFAAKKNLLGENAFSAINKLVIYFTLPCLTFAKLQQSADPAIMGDLGLTFVLALGSMLLCGGAGYMLFKKETPERRIVFTHLVMLSNSGFMGYPVMAAAIGGENLIYGVMYVAAFNALAWSLGAYLFGGKAGLSIKKIFLNPALIAVILGLICFVCNFRLPQIPLNAIELLGDTTTPLAMLVVGARLKGLKINDLKDKNLLIASGLKLIVFPLIVLGILILLNVHPLVKAAVYICTAMPGASVSAMQAEHYNGDSALTSRGVAFTTALSVITIPVMLLLL